MDKEEFYNYCMLDEIEKIQNMTYKTVVRNISECPSILENICLFGSWRIFNYLLSICSSETIKENTNIYNCLKNILSIENLEDSASYIGIMLNYGVMTNDELFHYLYMFLDMKDNDYYKSIIILLYENELDDELFIEYMKMMNDLKEKAVLKMFGQRQYEIGLVSMILEY